MIRLLALATLASLCHWWTVAAVLCLPIAYVAGEHNAIRRSGVGMVRGGVRRIRTGRL